MPIYIWNTIPHWIMVMTTLTSSCTGSNCLALPTAKTVTKIKRVRYKVKNERKFVMDHQIPFDSGGVGSSEQTLDQ